MNFEMEVTNILETRAYELTDEGKVSVIKNWLDQEGLQLMKTFTLEEKKKSRTAKGLFSVLSNKIKAQYNRIVISLQYHKLRRESNESAQVWMAGQRQ